MRHGERGPAALEVVLPDSHQGVRISEGQWPQHHGVDHAEDRGIGADAEGQRQGGDEGEARALPERSRGVPDILQK
jgi:hypothetical protein